MQLPVLEYIQAAGARGLLLPPDLELNWSGKENGGQHVEFAKREELPLEAISKIGMSLTATVDKVRCRRIMLARKTMTCGRRLSIQDALVEVEHLQKLRHAHIVQLVGSYLQGKKFAVLIYPVADCDLGNFLEEVSSSVVDSRVLGEEVGEMQYIFDTVRTKALTFQSDNIWLDATLEMLLEDSDKRNISWVPLYLDGETCSSCDGVREVYCAET